MLALPLVCAFVLSCRSTRVTPAYPEPPPDGIKPTVIEYVEKDAFDELFESALVNQDAAILIQTETSRPDWGPRLNAWIAAWNRGGKTEEPRIKVRLQAPLAPVTINGETLREFRLLIDDLVKHADDLARRGSSWWVEERTQRRRIALLRPYSLRFHLDSDKNIQLVFFNGMYAPYYRQFIEAHAMNETDEVCEWSRDMKCSHCKGMTTFSTVQRTRARLGNPVAEAPQ